MTDLTIASCYLGLGSFHFNHFKEMAFPESAGLLQFLLCNKAQQEQASLSGEHLWMCKPHRMPDPRNCCRGPDLPYSSHNMTVRCIKGKPLLVSLSGAAKLYKQLGSCEVLLSYWNKFIYISVQLGSRAMGEFEILLRCPPVLLG